MSSTDSRVWPGEGPQLVTAKRAGEMLSISRSKLYELMTSGRLPYVKIGRARRIDLVEIRELIANAQNARK